MTDIVKSELKKCFVVFWGFVALTASIGAVNCPGVFYTIVGIANLVINGYCIYKYCKNLNHEEK